MPTAQRMASRRQGPQAGTGSQAAIVFLAQGAIVSKVNISKRFRIQLETFTCLGLGPKKPKLLSITGQQMVPFIRLKT